MYIVVVVVKIKMLRTVTNLVLNEPCRQRLDTRLKVNDISHTEVSVERKLPIEFPMFLCTVKKPPKQKPKGISQIVMELSGSASKPV